MSYRFKGEGFMPGADRVGSSPLLSPAPPAGCPGRPARCQGPTKFDPALLAPISAVSGPMLVLG